MSEPAPRILVVDDEPFNRELLEAMLLPLGYDVELAENGAECLAAIAKSPPDTVLLDVMMPGMDGIEVCRRIKSSQRYNTIPVVMVTALRDSEHRIAALKAGADDFLSKPVDKQELLARLRSSLRIKAARDSEHQLLDATLNGAVRVLSELVSTTDQPLFAHAAAVRYTALELAPTVGLHARWAIELAAMLAPLGVVTVPDELRARIRARGANAVSTPERQVLARVPRISHDLVKRIPRLDTVAKIILGLSPRYFGWEGIPDLSPERTPESLLLDLASALNKLEQEGLPRNAALLRLRDSGAAVDETMLSRLIDAIPADAEVGEVPAEGTPSWDAAAVEVWKLMEGDVIARDVFTKQGHKLIAAGHVLTAMMQSRLTNFSETVGIVEPIYVRRRVVS